MITASATRSRPDRRPETNEDLRSELGPVIDRVIARIAPLWPLDRFVAVNPYLGLLELGAERAAALLARTAGSRPGLPREHYRRALAAGLIRAEDLREALAEHPDHAHLPAAAALRAEVEEGREGARPSPTLTVADLAGRIAERDWSAQVIESISGFLGARLAGGCGGVLPDPRADLPAFAAWRLEAAADLGPEIAGLPGFRRFVAAAPPEPVAAIAAAARELGLAGPALELHLHRLLMTVGGWAACARRLDQEGATDLTRDLLAIRITWEAALLVGLRDRGLGSLWARARAELDGEIRPEERRELAIDLVLQAALEKASRRPLLRALARGPASRPARRAALQAVFCIDVRSEPLRRALEQGEGAIETLGFAGFFGLALSHRPLGGDEHEARCPVIARPGLELAEIAAEGAEERARRARARGGAWTAFKEAAVSSFAFVETMGLLSAWRLVKDSLFPAAAGPREAAALELRRPGSPTLALDVRARADQAEAALRGMSLTRGFARLVLFVGHGSTSTNNLHASGLDCGACGGHAGDLNARALAATLRDAAVRDELRRRGLAIPDDTSFLAALHDTTTDRIVVLDGDELPATHRTDLQLAEERLRDAGRRAGAARARRFGFAAGKQLLARATDWSQIRPEWGLAGCRAFIAAPRARSRDLDLEGRAFLHGYDWQADEGFGLLEQIMTAPMVVASWINLQYHASTLDERNFGSGDKTLHNAVGRLGVVEGQGGDLRPGLPRQSVHDGEAAVHEPHRLDVIIEAPAAAIERIVARHEDLGRLFDGGFIHLFAIDGMAGAILRRRRGGSWLAEVPLACAATEDVVA